MIWLFKSEPDNFSIDDLKEKKIEHWDGVRNYQARNFLRDEVKLGDIVLFYHSSCKVPAIVGEAVVVKESYPDHTQFDKKSNYYDPKSTEENPRWFMVDIKFKTKYKVPLELKSIKEDSVFKDFKLISRGNRLSIFPVEKKYLTSIRKLIL